MKPRRIILSFGSLLFSKTPYVRSNASEQIVNKFHKNGEGSL